MVTNMDYYTRQHEIEMKELEVLGVLGLVAIPCVTNHYDLSLDMSLNSTI